MDDATIDFVPSVRAGRRAPHIWVDENNNQSVLDWFITDYTLIVGKGVAVDRWQSVVNATSVPVNTRVIDDESGLYDAHGLVLVRPDGVIADCWQDSAVENGDEGRKLNAYLPG